MNTATITLTRDQLSELEMALEARARLLQGRVARSTEQGQLITMLAYQKQFAATKAALAIVDDAV